MPRGGAQPNSGRKSARDERLMSLVINKSWDILSKSLDEDYKSYKTTEAERRTIALEIAKKTIPKNIKLDDSVIVKLSVDTSEFSDIVKLYANKPREDNRAAEASSA